MKKILILLLAITLLLLSGCVNAPSPSDIDNSSNHKSSLEEWKFNIEDVYTLSEITDDNVEELKAVLTEMVSKLEASNGLDMSDLSGNIAVEKAAVVSNEKVSVKDELKSKLLIIDEREFYSDSSEEYVYVFFNMGGESSSTVTTKCNSVNIESGILSVALTRKSPTSPDGNFISTGDVVYRTVILKVQKSSLGEGYTPNEDSNTPVNNELTDSDKEALRALLESDNLQELNKSEATGNIPVENAFMIREALPDGLSCDLEYDRERDIFISQRIILCDESKLYPDSSDEYVYLFFNLDDSFRTDAVKDCYSVNLEDDMLSVELSIGFEFLPSFELEDLKRIFPTTVIFKFSKSAIEAKSIKELGVITQYLIFPEVTPGELIIDEQIYISKLLKNNHKENEGYDYVEYDPTTEGNAAVKQIYEFTFFGGTFYHYTQELASGDIENVIVKDEKELYPDSNEEYVYLFLFYTEASHDVVRFEITSVNVENGLANIKINLLGFGGEESMTNHMIVLKIDKNSFNGDIEKIHVDMTQAPR